MARKGEVLSEETKAKMRDAARRRWGISPENPDPPRRCRVCARTLPARLFVKVRTTTAGTVHRRGPCQICREQERRAAGIPIRRKRFNAAGDVWCNNCQRYLPTTSFRRHPERRHTYRAYCTACTRELDRQRWRGERRDQSNASRLVRQRKERAAVRSERRDFVKGAIATLRKRGFTKSDIARLTGTSLSLVLSAEKGSGRFGPTPNTAERFVVALRETGHLPAGREPAHRRRQPPGFDDLVARIRPLMDAYPTRSRWKEREERAS